MQLSLVSLDMMRFKRVLRKRGRAPMAVTIVLLSDALASQPVVAYAQPRRPDPAAVELERSLEAFLKASASAAGEGSKRVAGGHGHGAPSSSGTVSTSTAPASLWGPATGSTGSSAASGPAASTMSVFYSEDDGTTVRTAAVPCAGSAHTMGVWVVAPGGGPGSGGGLGSCFGARSGDSGPQARNEVVVAALTGAAASVPASLLSPRSLDLPTQDECVSSASPSRVAPAGADPDAAELKDILGGIARKSSLELESRTAASQRHRASTQL